ncbi:ATP-binding protein [Brevibacillus fluminis]|uniref:ATP-binding protein n=1 Tax=Brevibacillus fluminis TaxID=511487 RepID=UPI003F8A1FA1
MKNRQMQSDTLSSQVQNKMRQTLQNLQNVVFTYTKREDGVFIYTLYEGKIAEELGLTTDTIFGKTLHQVFTAKKADYLTRFYKEAYKGIPVTYEFEYAGKMFHNVLSPIIEHGEVVEVVGSAIDISDRKKMELQLAKARDQALLSSQLKSEFLSTMSHEIRTPMNGIIGMIDLLLQSPLNDEQQRYANIVKTSAHSLLAIINDILDFSKMEAGKMQLEIIDFDLQALMEDTVELMAAKASAKQLPLYLYVDPSLPPVWRGDSGRIRQVLLNLIGNAIKFTHSGEIAIRVTANPDTAQTSTLSFSVRDTGIGIPKEEAHRLFQPFTQIDGSASRQFAGTGLGLSICKHIAQLMDGEISFESEVNKGATFTFTIPLERVQDQDQQAASRQVFALPPELRILCILHNPRDYEHIREYLSSLGVQSNYAQNVEQTASLFLPSKRMPYDFLIVDCEENDLLPLYATINRSKNLKIIKIHPSLPFAKETKPASAQPILFDSYLSRPIKQSQLLYLLSDQKKQTHQLPHWPEEPQPGNAWADKANFQLLLTEDNEINAEIVTLQLKQLGLHPHLAKNGLEALGYAAKHRYDLIFMDCQMPEMNGFEATRRIRQSELSTGLHVPIIALTANAMREDRDLCLEAGMDDYLSKPFTFEQLQAILEKWLPGTIPHKVPFDEQKVIHLFRRGAHPDGQEKWHAFLQTFERQNTKALAQLKEAILQKDQPFFTRILHSTKSGCAFIGAISLVELLAQMEEMHCKPNYRQTEVLAHLSVVQREFGRVHEYLRGLQPS